MKKFTLLMVLLFIICSVQAQLSLKAPGVKWDTNYTFDKSNQFKMEMYAKNNEVSLQNTENYVVDFKDVEMNTAINKVNYYTF